RQLAALTFRVTFLREKCRQGQSTTSEDLTLIWNLIYGALTSPRLSRPLGTVSCSACGFMYIPLCSLVKEENIEEFFRLYIWLPD
ncbi:hypothetical protein F5884DRAFT_638657, partial [Xylogone sp. PMI_703]